MNRVLYFPIRILLFFLIFTEILFFVSPQIWNIKNGISLAFYLGLMNLALYLGYRDGLKKRIRSSKLSLTTKNIKVIITLTFLIKFTFIFLDSNFSFSSLKLLVFGGVDLGTAYYERNQEINTGYYILKQILSPLVFMGFAFGIYYWKQLNNTYRCLYISAILIELTEWLSIGVRKGILDIFLIIFLSYLLSNYHLILNKVKLKKIKIYFFVFLMVFLSLFLLSNLARMYQYDSFTDMLDDSTIPIHDFYKEHFPRPLIMPLVSISSYLCQGYYALAKTLEVGIIYPNLLATNMFTVNIAERFGYDALSGSYLDILNARYGISPTVNWHSIYVWLANGFTLIGVPLFIYFIGFMLSNSWKSSILKNDALAIPLFIILFQTGFYFFANNQMFSFSFFSIFFFLLSYLLNWGNRRVK